MQAKPLQFPHQTEFEKAAQYLALTIQANNYAPPDELEATTDLQDLILVNIKNCHKKDKTVEPLNVPTPIKNFQTNK